MGRRRGRETEHNPRCEPVAGGAVCEVVGSVDLTECPRYLSMLGVTPRMEWGRAGGNEMTRAGVGNSMSVVSQIKRDKGPNGFALNAR